MVRDDRLLFPEPIRVRVAGGLLAAAAAVGVVGLALAAVGASGDAHRFWGSYLFAFRFWFGMVTGALGLLMTQHLSGGVWGYLIRRPLEAAARTWPLFALLVIPVLVGAPSIYPWATSAAVLGDPRLRHKALYLNVPFFVVRAAIYFAVLALLSWLLNRWSRQQDADPASPAGRRLRVVSGPGLIVLAFVITFSAVDWVMSLEPHWWSTMYGFLYCAGDALSMMCVAILVLIRLRRDPQVDAVATQGQFQRLGNLTLTLVVLWAYFQFSQLLVIWSGDVLAEITWYIHRARGGWQWIALALALLHFFVPFFYLLSRRNKHRLARLAAVLWLLLVMRVVATFWMVVPAFVPQRISVTWVDLAALAGAGGLWLAFFGWQLGREPVLPLADTRLEPVPPLAGPEPAGRIP